MNYIQTEKKDVHFRIISKQLGTNYGILDSHGDLIDIVSGLQIETWKDSILSIFPVKMKYTTMVKETIAYPPECLMNLMDSGFESYLETNCGIVN